MVLLQRAVSPALSRAYLREGRDRVHGFVVRVEDVAFARTPAELQAVHGLHAPGSPFGADDEWIDLLRFDAAPHLRYLPAAGYVVPLWWLMPARVPAGAQLVRRYADGSMDLLAVYEHVGTGWRALDREAPVPAAPISQCLGPVALWESMHLDADPVGDDLILASSQQPPEDAGFRLGGPSRWWRAVPRDDAQDLFCLEVTARWRGMSVRVVDQTLNGDLALARITPASDDVTGADERGLPVLDVDVVEGWVPTFDLDDMTSARTETERWTPRSSQAQVAGSLVEPVLEQAAHPQDEPRAW